jgi:hypothetical protein
VFFELGERNGHRGDQIRITIWVRADANTKAFDSMARGRRRLKFAVSPGGSSVFNSAVTRYNKKNYEIAPRVSIERNAKDTHRYAIDAKGILIDATWRQFYRHILGKGTPAIFVGTTDELESIVVTAGADAAKIKDYIYTGTRAKETYG